MGIGFAPAESKPPSQRLKRTAARDGLFRESQYGARIPEFYRPSLIKIPSLFSEIRSSNHTGAVTVSKFVYFRNCISHTLQ